MEFNTNCYLMSCNSLEWFVLWSIIILLSLDNHHKYLQLSNAYLHKFLFYFVFYHYNPNNQFSYKSACMLLIISDNYNSAFQNIYLRTKLINHKIDLEPKQQTNFSTTWRFQILKDYDTRNCGWESHILHIMNWCNNAMHFQKTIKFLKRWMFHLIQSFN